MSVEINYLYQNSNLPKIGWIQACFNCREFTSRTILFKTHKKNNILYEFHVHCCPRCKRQNKKINHYIAFSKKCNDQIKEDFGI